MIMRKYRAAPSTGGSNYNIGQIRDEELDFGVAQSDWQYHAYNAEFHFIDRSAIPADAGGGGFLP